MTLVEDIGADLRVLVRNCCWPSLRVEGQGSVPGIVTRVPGAATWQLPVRLQFIVKFAETLKYKIRRENSLADWAANSEL